MTTALTDRPIPTHGMHRMGALALLGAAAMFGLYGPLIRLMSHSFGGSAQVTVRTFLAFLFASVLMVATGRAAPIGRTQHARLLALGCSQICTFSFITVTVTQTKITNSIFLLYAGSILMSSFLGFVILREHLSRFSAGSIALTICGLGIYNGITLSIGFATVAGVLAGCFVAVTGTLRKLLSGGDHVAIVWATMGYATLLSLVPLAFAHHHAFIGWTPSALVGALVFGILIVTQGQLVMYGYTHVNLSSGAVILSTEVVFGTFYGWLGFSELPNAREVAGASLIVLGAIAIAWRGGSRTRQPRD